MLNRTRLTLLPALLPVLLLSAAPLGAGDVIRIGTLKFGTVNWELDTIRRHALDREQGIAVEVREFANKQAAHIVFQSGEVDIIVTDWVWVSRERGNGKPFSFIPYSFSLGAVMIPAGSGAEDLRGLRGLRVGVAGGSYDKSWLLLRAWAQKQHGFDPLEAFDVQYAAPPLLNGQIEREKLDAVLNFWHYCARLEAAGYRRLLEIGDVIAGLGIGATPMVGYVFNEPWARKHAGIVARFNAAARNARDKLLKEDAEWESLRPLMRVDDEAAFIALRDRYREGIPARWGERERANATRLMELLAQLGGDKLTGGARLAQGTFWEGVSF